MAILSNTLATDTAARIASIASSANVLLYAAINFDPSSGLLTGLALSGRATDFKPKSTQFFPPTPFVVDRMTPQDEWTALQGFLSYVAKCLEQGERISKGGSAQIHFWDQRQYKELCDSMGRHLPKVMALADRKERALAWLFPDNDKMLGDPAHIAGHSVVFLSDVARRVAFTPTPHAMTLFGTGEHYAFGVAPVERDAYYREYLTDGIPRERIYEIWMSEKDVKRGADLIPRNTAIARLSDTLEKQVRSMESVAERIRADFKGKFHAVAPKLAAKVPLGASNVSLDGKLWIWWDRLNFVTTQAELHAKLGLEGERLEATYEALILRNGRRVLGATYEFDVPVSSREAKFGADSTTLTIGKVGRPGMPLERAAAIVSQASIAAYAGKQAVFNLPLWSLIGASIDALDRVKGVATVTFSCWGEPAVIPYLFANSTENLLTDVFLVEAKRPKGFDWSDTSSQILQAIGSPPIEVPSPEAAMAIGVKLSKAKGTSPITPVARILWDAGTVEAEERLPRAIGARLAAHVGKICTLNSSQEKTVEHALTRGLTVIWGPPGTGKTQTLGAFIHAMTLLANTSKGRTRILIAGPTYKAVQVLLARLLETIDQDSAAICRVWMGYSSAKRVPGAPHTSSHVSHTDFVFSDADKGYRDCLKKLQDNSPGVDIVGVQVLQARKISLALHQRTVGPVFDAVILDESSQIPVSQALSPLGSAADESRIVVAGDHLQMPPIAALDPPRDAAYLVGSIQTYLQRRGFRLPLNVSSLDVSYRSNKQIVGFLRRIGYSAALTAQFPDLQLHFLKAVLDPVPVGLVSCADSWGILRPDRPVVTVVHQDETSSQGNLFEAKLVAGLISQLRGSVSARLSGEGAAVHSIPDAAEFWGTCVGIVTPHKAQRALVVNELTALFPAEANLLQEAVDTVEKFQGGQRHTIIVSFGVADIDVIAGEEVFLLQSERMNVAVSRARAKSIVIMPSGLAEHIPENRRALETAHAVKEYIGIYCATRQRAIFSYGSLSRDGEIRYL